MESRSFPFSFDIAGRYAKHRVQRFYRLRGTGLQFEKFGYFNYYFNIAPNSTYYALEGNRYGITEIDANNRSYNFFGKPTWWHGKYFPLTK